MGQQKVFLFTNAFPYGKGEQFLESEINYLAQNFKEVFIFPHTKDGDKRDLPSNCRVIDITVKFEAKKKIRHYVFKHVFKTLYYFIYLLFQSKKRLYYIKHASVTLIDLAILLEESDLYYAAYKDYLNEASLLYFYWFKTPFIQFALLKSRKKINQQLVSRALGYDYDPAQNSLGFFLYREIELKQINNLVANSRWGAELIKNLYPSFSSKVSYSYLGLEDSNCINPVNETAIFHLVSCSFLIELKRVNLIIEILKHINIPLKWTHIGEGPLLEEIKKSASMLPSNIESEFLGFIPSVEDYYKKNACDLFITTTRSEGLPFSIMESIAYGIPAMGTAVCGIPEVVNDNTGFLIDENFNLKDAANIITNYSLKSIDEKKVLRKSARQFYEKTFTSKKNINDFITNYLN